MFLQLLLSLISCTFCFSYTGSTAADLDSDGVLYKSVIQSPNNYKKLLEERPIKKIEISGTDFTEELVSDFAERFRSWPSLHSINIAGCTFPGNLAREFAQILVSLPQINQVEMDHTKSLFIGLFLEELLSTKPYLKKLKIASSCDYSHSPLVNQADKLKEALSLVEDFDLILYERTVVSVPQVRTTSESKDHYFFTTLLQSMPSLKNLFLYAQQNVTVHLMQSISSPEKIEGLNVKLTNSTFDPVMKVLGEMKNLKEFWIHPQFHEEKDSQLISVLQTLPIEKLHIRERMNRDYLENFLPIKTLKQVSINLNLFNLSKFTELIFRASVDEFPFEIEGDYHYHAVKSRPFSDQSLDQMFCSGIKALKFVSYMNDAFIEEFKNWLLTGNGAGIEEFEVNAREGPLKNFGVCLALMPNLKKLTVLNANEEYGSDFFEWLLRWECNSLEEL